MKKSIFGFIGVGNMGAALATNVCKGVNPELVTLANRTTLKAKNLATNLGCNYADNITVAKKCKYIFLGVKPQMMVDLLSEIAPVLRERTDSFILVTMAAGLSISKIQELSGKEYPVIRIMPNTPVSVGEGVVLYSESSNVSNDDIAEFISALSNSGKICKIDEKLIDAASAVSGCGPAFVYMFIEAMADGAVECGLPRDKAVEYAAQTLLGAARLTLLSGKHPGKLKDEVCSPAGSTIAGVHALENGAFRSSVMNSVVSAFNRTKELGNK